MFRQSLKSRVLSTIKDKIKQYQDELDSELKRLDDNLEQDIINLKKVHENQVESTTNSYVEKLLNKFI